MSKSEWKEMPDWTKPEDYSFLNDASPEVWAWEFLRRNEAYRKDWLERDAMKDTYHYDPPKLDNLNDQQWRKRMMYTTWADPIKMRKELYIANKWALEKLCDPKLPYTPSVRFIKPGSDFPRLIFLPDEFYALVEDDETEERAIQRVADSYAVIGFDITRPLGEQIEIAEAKLQAWKKQLKAAKKIKAKGHANKFGKWLRHIRILDALRMQPRASYFTIASSLGGNGTTKEELRIEGQKFVAAARKIMQEDYRKILLSKGTPGKNTP